MLKTNMEELVNFGKMRKRNNMVFLICLRRQAKVLLEGHATT